MKKSNYRNGNETMICYNNKITAKLVSYGLESLNILRTETLLFIDKDIEHFKIEVTVPNKLSDVDVETFYKIIEQQVLPEYMKDFYNTVDFKVILFDESGKSQKIERIFENKQVQYEDSSENTKFQMQDYKYIIKCDLDEGNTIYQDQYLLVEDFTTPSDLDIDLVGDCCFNCDFEVLDSKLVAKVQSLDDVKKFCELNKIDITKNLDKEGNLIVGASKDMIIASDLNRYDREQEIKKEL